MSERGASDMVRKRQQQATANQPNRSLSQAPHHFDQRLSSFPTNTLIPAADGIVMVRPPAALYPSPPLTLSHRYSSTTKSLHGTPPISPHLSLSLPTYRKNTPHQRILYQRTPNILLPTQRPTTLRDQAQRPSRVPMREMPRAEEDSTGPFKVFMQ
jgi:hypothetical protein